MSISCGRWEAKTGKHGGTEDGCFSQARGQCGNKELSSAEIEPGSVDRVRLTAILDLMNKSLPMDYCHNREF